MNDGLEVQASECRSQPDVSPRPASYIVRARRSENVRVGSGTRTPELRGHRSSARIQSEFDSAKYLLLAALGSDCGRLDAFFPDAERAGVDGAFDRFVAASARANTAQAQLKQLRALGAGQSGAGAYGKADGIESLDRFRFVVETRLGLSTGSGRRRWKKAATTSPGQRRPLPRWPRICAGGRTDNPEIKARAELRTFSEGDPYCAYLSRRSRPR